MRTSILALAALSLSSTVALAQLQYPIGQAPLYQSPLIYQAPATPALIYPTPAAPAVPAQLPYPAYLPQVTGIASPYAR